jgi:hypothetical protein
LPTLPTLPTFRAVDSLGNLSQNGMLKMSKMRYWRKMANLLYGQSQRPLDLCDTLAARHGGMD